MTNSRRSNRGITFRLCAFIAISLVIVLPSNSLAAKPPKAVKEAVKELWEKVMGIGKRCLKGACQEKCVPCEKCLKGLSDEVKDILAKDRNSDAFAHELGQHLGISPENPIFKDGFVNVKGSAVDYKKAMQNVADFMEKYPCYAETVKGKGVALMHGSGSHSLVNLNDGLKPAGVLIQNGNVPFSGELTDGLLPGGVSNDKLSTTALSHMHWDRGWGSALNYANTCGSSSWNPEIGRKNLKELNELLPQAQALGHTADIPRLQSAISIEEARLARWETLTDEQKKLVCESYPVLYGINPSRIDPTKISYPRSDAYGEMSVQGGAAWSDIQVVYVPKDKVDEVAKRLAANAATKHVEVFPIDTVFTCPKQFRTPRW